MTGPHEMCHATKPFGCPTSAPESVVVASGPESEFKLARLDLGSAGPSRPWAGGASGPAALAA
jgi:hypothetical protein